MKSIIFTVLFLGGLCSQQSTILGINSGPNQLQANRIARITSFTHELGEFLRCISVKTTRWQRFFGTEKWVPLGQNGHEQLCQVNSWIYKKQGNKGVHVLRGITHDFTFEYELEIDQNGSPEISAETSLDEKENQILLTLTSKQIQVELKKFIEWYQPNPNDMHDKEIDALNNLKKALRIFLSTFKKEFGDELLIEHEIINLFLSLKLPSKSNKKRLVALAFGGALAISVAVFVIGKLTGPGKKLADKAK